MAKTDFKLIFLILLFLTPSYYEGQKILTLRECIEIAKKNNFELKGKGIEIEIAKEQLIEAKKFWIPSINAYINNYYNLYSHNHDLDEIYAHEDGQLNSIDDHDHPHFGRIYSDFTNDIGIESSLMLYNFNSQKLREGKGHSNYISKVYEASDSENKIIINVLQKYVDVNLNQDFLKISENNIENIGNLLKATEKKFEVGVITKFELFQVKQEFNNAVLDLAQQKMNLEKSKLSLLSFLQLDYNEEIIVEQESPHSLPLDLYSSENISEEILLNPQIMAQKNKLNVLQYQTELLKNNIKPKIYLIYSLGTNFKSSLNTNLKSEPILTQWQNNVLNKWGVSVSIPILNRYSDKSAINQSKLEEEKQKNEILTVENELNTIIQSEIIEFNSTFELIDITKEKVNNSSVVFEMSQIAYNSGVINLLELNKARYDHINDQINLIRLQLLNHLRAKIINIYLNKNEKILN